MSQKAEMTIYSDSTHHRTFLKNSEQCGCYYCLKQFDYQQIEDWLESEDTALCPFCGIDAVIGSAKGHPLPPELLQEMKDYYF